MPRAKVNYSKKSSGSGSGLKFFIFICLLLAAQNCFLIYRNYDKASAYWGSLWAADSTANDAADDSLFAAEELPVAESDQSQQDGSKTAVQSPKNDEPDAAEKQPDQTSAVPQKMVKVSIVNGCGVTGLAGKWKSALRDLNYDVRETDNSKEKYPASVILCRTDDRTAANQLAAKLGIAKKNVIPQKNKNIVDIDITLVLGKDHARLKIK